MANGKFAEMLDARLLEAAWHRFETARALANARRAKDTATEIHQRAMEAHSRASIDFDNLERDIAAGVRLGAGRQVVQQAREAAQA
jgi:hypothetical protein